ncbi:conserved hypothetical protein [Candidatus Propionivibrio aalborgensis]|uniref:Integrase catalytic domain-containing protein n=1 Tax=Candidatus Propionivibrio aalborgensis TaxID=1860101 RepID=A0A1A8Y1Z0_9RHOO|nr:hypothetical protein [Candidatus Propionivibrio aalborgensis]SBT11150.1 conserved hypothetical protein [Candidatus Propionivibrio aalborgensis]
MNQFITRSPIPGEVITSYHSNHEDAPDAEFFRVLAVNKQLDRIAFVRATPKQSAGRLYFLSPRVEKLSWLLSEDISKQFVFLSGGLPPRPDVQATPEELDNKYLRRGQEQSTPRKERAERFELIKPLVKLLDPEDVDLLLDPQIRAEKINQRARELATSPTDVKRLRRRITDTLNQYWAEGSVSGSVTPYTSRCGGRGKEKKQGKKKMGPPNRATQSGEIGLEGHILSDEEKDQCGFAWRHYNKRGKTRRKAFRKLKREFYSDIVIGEDGHPKRIVHPDIQCPTETQFEYWGKIRSPGHDSWKKQLTPRALARIDRVLFGYANETVIKIGQRGAIDSTTTDQEFVSVINRLNRIGQAHRVLIVDSKYKYIPGFYMGLDAPGSLPVQLAYLHALTEKREWLKWLGLEEQELENWITIRFATLLADNTDARAAAAMNAFENVNTGLKFVPVSRSDMNSDVETTHHGLHRLVDHNLVGTTYGQRTERGVEKADVLARMTIIEAIRETARAIYAWNTMELDIVPTLEMQRELVDKGIKLTRANLTRWEIERGNQATSLISEAEARIALLIPTRGTFTQNGIRLLRTDKGQKREFVSHVRYASHHKQIVKKCLEAKVMRSRVMPTAFDDDFLYDPYRPSEIYYRDLYSGELIPLAAKTHDSQLLEECSLPDIYELDDANKLRLFFAESGRERQISDLEAEQEEANDAAEAEYQATVEKVGKSPSKSSIRKGKKSNRETEKTLMDHGMPIIAPETAATETVEPEQSPIDSAPVHKPGVVKLPLVKVTPPPEPATEDIASTTAPLPAKKSVFARIVQSRQTEVPHA